MGTGKKVKSFLTDLFYFAAVVLPLIFLFFLVERAYQKSLYKPLLAEFKEGRELSPSEYERLYEVFGPEVRDEEGNTVLHRLVAEACRERKVPEFLRELLSEISPNERNYLGQTPVHLAVKSCQDGKVLRELLSLFVEFNADLNAKDCAGNTPLFYAVSGPFNGLKVFLEFKPQVNAKNFYGWTPLCVATLKDYGEEFALLEGAGGKVEERCGRVSIPELAQTLRSVEVIEFLKQKGIEPEEVKGNLRELLFTPSVKKRCVREDFEGKIRRALTLAVLTDDAERVEAFYRAGLFPEDGKVEGLPVALFAVKKNSSCASKVLELLLSKGLLKPEERFEEGKTLLHACAERGCKECVKVLVKWGADPNAKDEKGFTPYCRAVAEGREETARELLKLGAEPNAACVKTAEELQKTKPWIEKLPTTPTR